MPSTFAQETIGENAAFELGSEIVDQNGVAVLGTKIAPEIFPDHIDWESTPHICPVLGAEEVWKLVNTTDEMHNLHIHQSKFRLADGRLDRGVPPSLRPRVAIGDNCAINPRESAFCDPLGLAGAAVPEAGGAVPGAMVDAWHDTIPVPPRDA